MHASCFWWSLLAFFNVTDLARYSCHTFTFSVSELCVRVYMSLSLVPYLDCPIDNFILIVLLSPPTVTVSFQLSYSTVEKRLIYLTKIKTHTHQRCLEMSCSIICSFPLNRIFHGHFLGKFSLSCFFYLLGRSASGVLFLFFFLLGEKSPLLHRCTSGMQPSQSLFLPENA